MTHLTGLDRFLLVVIILLLGVIAIQNSRVTVPGPAWAQSGAPDGFPIRIANAEEISGGVAAFPVDTQGRFVVVDGAARRLMFCEVVWAGPDAALSVRNVKDF